MTNTTGTLVSGKISVPIQTTAVAQRNRISARPYVGVRQAFQRKTNDHHAEPLRCWVDPGRLAEAEAMGESALV